MDKKEQPKYYKSSKFCMIGCFVSMQLRIEILDWRVSANS